MHADFSVGEIVQLVRHRDTAARYHGCPVQILEIGENYVEASVPDEDISCINEAIKDPIGFFNSKKKRVHTEYIHMYRIEPFYEDLSESEDVNQMFAEIFGI